MTTNNQKSNRKICFYCKTEDNGTRSVGLAKVSVEKREIDGKQTYICNYCYRKLTTYNKRVNESTYTKTLLSKLFENLNKLK